jgi:hypothetical protein
MTEAKTFEPVRLLTRPVLKLEIDVTRHVKITGAMHFGKEQKSGRSQDKDAQMRAPATLVDCVNLEDGALCQLVVPAVVKSVLSEEYPGDVYVGKCFSITKLEQQRGKDYYPYNVVEIRDPGEPASIATAAKKR